jgi:DNA modification methylase
MVLDPSMGSGTNGRVCGKLGRGFVGYDLKKYD